eukprot:Nk52_evm1s127 gene=Nk52_evmTU1s127
MEQIEASTTRATGNAGNGEGNSSGGLKLGIVHLGKICGKHKYMLLDAQDIPFVRKFSFSAKLDVNRDGNGASIFAHAYLPRGEESEDVDDEMTEGRFEALLWRHRYGSISPGHVVIHRNGISVDNRLSNLELIKSEEADALANKELDECEIARRQSEANLYRAALAQLPPFPEDDYNENNSCVLYNSNGEAMEEDSDQMLYECHYPPCHNIESHSRQFNICGRCRLSRYCGTRCQQLDWSHHKTTCKKKESKRERSNPYR